MGFGRFGLILMDCAHISSFLRNFGSILVDHPPNPDLHPYSEIVVTLLNIRYAAMLAGLCLLHIMLAISTAIGGICVGKSYQDWDSSHDSSFIPLVHLDQQDDFPGYNVSYDLIHPPSHRRREVLFDFIRHVLLGC